MFFLFGEGEVGRGIWVERKGIGCNVCAVGFLQRGDDVVGYAGGGVWVEINGFEGEFVEGGLVEDVPLRLGIC